MKYVHRFGPGVTCEVEVTDTPPLKGQSHILSHRWSKRPKPKTLPEYIRWMHLVNSNCANRWGLRLMHIFQVTQKPSDWQCWGYAPDEAPKRLDMSGLSDITYTQAEINDLNSSLLKDSPIPDTTFKIIDHDVS